VLYHYIIGVGAFVLLSAAWVGVQRAWRQSFSDFGDDPDALAGRSGCHGCVRAVHCDQRPESGACEAQEEIR
jgi:hypothetical protein